MFTAQDQARIAKLTKEIGMLSKAQAHLSGIPARHNAIRIAERQDLLNTLTILRELTARDDAAEIELAAAHA